MSNTMMTASNFQQFTQGFNQSLMDNLLTQIIKANIFIQHAFKHAMGSQQGNQVALTRPEEAKYTTIANEGGSGGNSLILNDSLYKGETQLYTCNALVASDITEMYKNTGTSSLESKNAQMVKQIEQSMANGVEQNTIATVLNGITNTIAGSGTPANAVGAITQADIVAASQLLTSADVPPVVKVIQPTQNYNTFGINESYVFIIPQRIGTSLSATSFITPIAYGNGVYGQTSMNEIGSIAVEGAKSVRCITSTIPSFNDPSANNELYSVLIGAEAYAFVGFDAMPTAPHKGEMPIDPKSRNNIALGITVSVTTERYNNGSLADVNFNVGQAFFSKIIFATFVTGVQHSVRIKSTAS